MNQTNRKRVLLISNSTLYGRGYLDHAEGEIQDFLGNIREVLFVPFALCDRDAYVSIEFNAHGRNAGRTHSSIP
jgi:peptidase E